MTTVMAPPSAVGGDAPRRWRSPDRVTAYGLAMTVSFLAYVFGHLASDDGAVGAGLSMVGASACGWAWLIARALFDPAPHDVVWPRIVVAIVSVAGALATAPLASPVTEVAVKVYALSGSAVLLLTFVEPFHRWRRDLPRAEKRFRLAFTAIYALLVAASILMPQGSAEDARRLDLLNTACAVVGLIAGGVAIGFRRRHPLASPVAARRGPTAEDRDLADRILHLLDEEALYARPNLKVAHVAARLGRPEYRVSQAITLVLGFDNFNRLINHHRIERAKRLLAEPGLQVLQVAFDCGFGSLGPFNRAFRAETGMTPRAWRKAAI